MFSFKHHFSCKFKHLSSAKQYPSPTSTLICRRVLPPGISRLSWNCIISYEFFIKYYILTDSNFSRALSYWTLKDIDNWTESALRFNNSSVSFYKYEFVPYHAIPSLFGYIIVVTILTVLPGPYSRSTNFRRWTNLTSILIVISFRLEQQAWFRVCVVPLVPITFHFIITLTWCRRRSITSSWTLATKVSWSSTFWAHPGYQLNSWWEIPSLPSMNCIIIDHFIAFPPTQACSCLVLYLEFLAILQLFFFTLEYYHPLCQECSENCSTSWEFLT